MSQNDGISGISGRKAASPPDLSAEFERAYQEELQNAKSGGGSTPDESALRQRALEKVRSRHPDADPALLAQTAWTAGQALQSLSRG